MSLNSYSNVTIVIPNYNNKELLEKLLDSLRTFMQYSNVIIVDNASTDGTYEKLFDYIEEDVEQFAVYRMKRPTKPARIMKMASMYLRFAPVHFSMYLNPGDIVYPKFVEEAVRIMHWDELIKAVFINVDINVNSEISEQKPIFANNCILDKETNYAQFFSAGIGRKVMAMHRNTWRNWKN